MQLCIRNASLHALSASAAVLESQAAVCLATLALLCTLAPSNAAFGAAVTSSSDSLIKILREMFADLNSEVRYFAAYTDLDGDGKKEAIVHVVGPQVCGTGGCETFVFTAEKAGYKLVTGIAITRPPVVVLPRSSHGWRNLAVWVAGGGIRPGYFAELRFDGRTYPENPTVSPARPLGKRPSGKTVIPRFQSMREGKLLLDPRP